MLKAFLDRGEKRGENGSVMCVAAVIFKPNAYKQFEHSALTLTLWRFSCAW
jgi:hypothetical protein